MEGNEESSGESKEVKTDLVNTLTVRHNGKKVSIPIDSYSNRQNLKIIAAKVTTVINKTIDNMLKNADEKPNAPIDADSIETIVNNFKRIADLTIKLYETPIGSAGKTGEDKDKLQVGGLIATVTSMSKDAVQKKVQDDGTKPIEIEVMEEYEKIAKKPRKKKAMPVFPIKA